MNRGLATIYSLAQAFFVDIWALTIETTYAVGRQGSGLIGLIQFTSC